MNRSLTTHGCVDSQCDAIRLLRAALEDEHVTTDSLEVAIKSVAHLVTRTETARKAPLQAEFLLAFAAAMITARACDGVEQCVSRLRYRAEHQALGYTHELDLKYTRLCRKALMQILLRDRVPACSTHRLTWVNVYYAVLGQQIQRKRILMTALAGEPEAMLRLALAS